MSKEKSEGVKKSSKRVAWAGKGSSYEASARKLLLTRSRVFWLR